MIEFNATFLIAMLSFVVFIMIMNAIFYQPVLNIIRKREEYISSNYENAQNTMEEAKKLEIERKTEITKTQKKCRKQFQSTLETFRSEATVKIKKAKENNKIIIQSEKEKLNESKEQLELALKESVVEDLAEAITSKIIGDKVQSK